MLLTVVFLLGAWPKGVAGTSAFNSRGIPFPAQRYVPWKHLDASQRVDAYILDCKWLVVASLDNLLAFMFLSNDFG